MCISHFQNKPNNSYYSDLFWAFELVLVHIERRKATGRTAMEVEVVIQICSVKSTLFKFNHLTLILVYLVKGNV